MKHVGKILGLLATAAIVGVVAAGGSDGDGSGHKTAGMVLAGDCSQVTVENPVEFMQAFISYAQTTEATEWIDPSDPASIEQFMIGFLGKHFPGCFPPVPGPDFTWTTLSPDEAHRSWAEVIDSIAEALEQIPPGWEGSDEVGAPLDLDGAASAAASSPGTEDPKWVIADMGEWLDDLQPDPTPNPLFPFPLPTPDPPSPEGEGGGWDVVPENVIQVRTAADMEDADLLDAMENDGTPAGEAQTIFLVFDPDWMRWPAMRARLYDYARVNPDVQFVIASTVDTRAAYGQPEAGSEMVYAYNAADTRGEWLSDSAVALARGVPAMLDPQWNELITFASGPYQASIASG